MDIADASNTEGPEGNHWYEQPAHAMAIHEKAEYRLKEVAGDTHDHDQNAGKCQR